MNLLARTTMVSVATLVSVVPEMVPNAPKRNLVVGLSYLLLLWVSGARLLAMLTGA